MPYFGGSGLIRVDRYPVAGSFQWTNPGARYVIIEGCGGGGGGGGAGTTGAAEFKLGYGAMWGGYGKVLVYSPESTLDIVVGAGGAGGVSVGAASVAGANGAPSTVTGTTTIISFGGGEAFPVPATLVTTPAYTQLTNANTPANSFAFAEGEILLNPHQSAFLTNISGWAANLAGSYRVNAVLPVLFSGPYAAFGGPTSVSNSNGPALVGNGAGGIGTFNTTSQVTPRTGGAGAPGLIMISTYR